MSRAAWFRRTAARVSGALLLWSAFRGGTAASETVAAAPDQAAYVITGTVVSARDGSPVPYAVLRAVPSPGGVRLAARTPAGAEQHGRSFGGRGGGAPQQPFGRPGRGRVQPVADEASATADGGGRFRLQVPHAGRWTLMAAAHGFPRASFDEHDGFFAAIVLSQAVPTYSLTFRLMPSAAIIGVVLDEAGEPVEHAQIFAERLPQPGADSADRAEVSIAATGGTDDRGRYELTPLPPGSYRIKVTASPWYVQSADVARIRSLDEIAAVGGLAPSAVDPALDVVYAQTWYPGATDPAGAELLTLHAGEEREADVQLTALPAVHLEAPLPPPAQEEEIGQERRQDGRGLVITHIASSGIDFAAPLQPNGSGMAVSPGLVPGLYQIRRGFDQRGGEQDVREIEIRAGTSGFVSLEDARPLLPVTVAFEGNGAAAAQRSGEVAFIDTASGRRIVANALEPADLRHGGTDTRGGDDAPAGERTVYLPPGRYAVYLDFSESVYLGSLSATGAQVDGREVTVADGKPKVTLQVGTGHAELGGIVRAAGSHDGDDDAPVEGAMVLLVPVTLGQPGSLAAPVRDESNTDGSFDLANVIPGRYILIAIDHGWDVNIHDAAGLAKYLVHGIPVEVAAGNHVERGVQAQAP